MDNQAIGPATQRNNQSTPPLANGSAVYTPSEICHIHVPTKLSQENSHRVPKQSKEVRVAINCCIEGFHQSTRSRGQKQQQLTKLEQILNKYSQVCYQKTTALKAQEGLSSGREQKKLTSLPSQPTEPPKNTKLSKPIMVPQENSRNQGVLTVLVVGLLIIAMLFALLLL